MPLWRNVVRGLLAVLVGVSVLFQVGAMVFDGDGLEALGRSLLMGVVMTVATASAVVPGWLVLSGKQSVATPWLAMLASAAMLLVYMLIGFAIAGDGLDLITFAIAVGMGAAFGAIFWVGAFGFQRRVQLGRPQDAP
jgi:hypothetical protein